MILIEYFEREKIVVQNHDFDAMKFHIKKYFDRGADAAVVAGSSLRSRELFFVLVKWAGNFFDWSDFESEIDIVVN